jgi:hypothetical protein
MMEVFNKMTTQQSHFKNTIFNTTVSHNNETLNREAGDMKRINSYLKIRKTFQSQHPIRIAIIGGLHRSALALHVLGNYKITNGILRTSSTSLYKLSVDSPINSGIALYVFSSNSRALDEGFLSVSRTFSEQVNDRRKKAIELMIAGQMWDLLKSKTTEDVDKHRYLPQELFGSKYVSVQIENCELSVFLDILTIQIFLVVLDKISQFTNEHRQQVYSILLQHEPIRSSIMLWKQGTGT